MNDVYGDFRYVDDQTQQQANMAMQGLGKVSNSTTDWIKSHWAFAALIGVGVLVVGWKAYGMKKDYQVGKEVRRRRKYSR